MGWGTTRLVDRIRERNAQQAAEFSVKSQARAHRAWGMSRLAGRAVSEGMPLPGALNPQGRAYNRLRLELPTTRPRNFFQRQVQQVLDQSAQDARLREREERRAQENARKVVPGLLSGLFGGGQRQGMPRPAAISMTPMQPIQQAPAVIASQQRQTARAFAPERRGWTAGLRRPDVEEGARVAAEFGDTVRRFPESAPALGIAADYPEGLSDLNQRQWTREDIARTAGRLLREGQSEDQVRQFIGRVSGRVPMAGDVAPVGDPQTLVGILLGEGAERGARRLGAPDPLAEGINIAAQIAPSVLAPTGAVSRLPTIARLPIETGIGVTGAPSRAARAGARGATVAEDIRPPRIPAVEEVVPPVRADVSRSLEAEAASVPPVGSPPAGRIGTEAAEAPTTLTSGSRQDFSRRVLYRGVRPDTAGNPNTFWTDDLELARFHAGDKGTIRIGLRDEVDPALIGVGEMNEAATLEQALRHQGPAGLEVRGGLRVVAEVPVSADPYDFIKRSPPAGRIGTEAAEATYEGPTGSRVTFRGPQAEEAARRMRSTTSEPTDIIEGTAVDVTPVGPGGRDAPAPPAAAEAAPEPHTFAGVGAATAELPTTRAIEAQSARIPIEDKQAVASEILANTAPRARPLTVDEVAAQWGNRYQSNWFTKLDNLIAPLRGRNRELERSVRNAIVTKDLYTHQEGLVQAQRVNEWIGKNKDILGLELNTGRARAVLPKPGVTIDRRAVQFLDDIRAHPEDYVISPEQQRALDDAGQLFETMKLSNYQHGVDFEALDAQTYWPRLVTNAPEGSGVSVSRRGAGADLAASPGFTKERMVPDRRQGVAAGVQYANPLDAMTARLVGGAEANGNRWAVGQVQNLGSLPSERVSSTLSENLRNARAAYVEARANAGKAATEAARHGRGDDILQAREVRLRASTANQEAIEAGIALDNAKAAMRAEANKVNALRPRVLGRVVKTDVKTELARYMQTEEPGVLDDIFQLMRGTMTTGDHSSLLNQNMVLFWRNNPAWMKAAGLSSMAFKEAPYAYAARNADAIEAAIRTGFASPPTEFLLRQGGGISSFAKNLPVIRQSQRAFEWNIFIGQVERYKGIAAGVKDPQQLMDIAAVTRKQAGILWTPGITRRAASALSKTFFAPQYTAAFVSTLTDPLLARGPARMEAIKSLSLMFGGAASLTIGASMAINGEMPNITDPDKAGYWGIRVGGGFVYPFGPFQPLVRTLALTAKGDRTALPRLLEGKASVLARLLFRAAEAMGVPLEEFRGPSYSDPKETFGKRGIGESFIDVAPIPIGAGQVAEGIREGAPITGLEVAGGRTTIETPHQEFIRLYKEKHGRDPDPAISPRQLDPELAEQAGYSAESEFTQERSEVTAEDEAQLAELAPLVLSGDKKAGEQFRTEISNFFKVRAGVTDALSRDLPERGSRLVNEFYDLDPRDFRDEHGQPDYDAYEAKRDSILAQLPPGARQALENPPPITFSDPQLQRVYTQWQAADAAREELYDIPKYRGITVEQSREYSDFMADVEEWRDERLERTGRKPSVDRGVSALRPSGSLRRVIRNMRDSRWTERNRNPAYLNHLRENRDELEPFYPDLYTADWVIKGLRRGR